MPTDLQLMYLRERVENRKRRGAALRSIAARIGVDTGTVARCLHRAKRADERDSRHADLRGKAGRS